MLLCCCELSTFNGFDCVLQVYRVYSNSQEFESIRLAETLSFLEDGKVTVPTVTCLSFVEALLQLTKAAFLFLIMCVQDCWLDIHTAVV